MSDRQFTPEDHAASKEAKAHFHNATPAEIVSKADLDATPEREALIERKLAEMPVTARKRYVTALQGGSREAAITSFCWECMGWVRTEVELCTALACPLYPYRPFTENEHV